MIQEPTQQSKDLMNNKIRLKIKRGLLILQDMWNDYNLKNNTPIGKIFQVYALQESSHDKLRLPKVGELRFDKIIADI